ncbi:hypothetical protein BG011_004526 [Mortierella polycephala]|uniref:NodB homology domain-containing protein n=1 Tax=Mortierella polycephala TaxID=41804 RepID=A0A9P6QFT1_9FUNG|nr:hypothetical protein BG011_004526 [Mortierella polycephala]
MKISAFLSCSAIFLATFASAVMPDDPNKIDTCKMPGVVAYTIDDGPGIYNDELLAIMAKKNVKATFYVLGRKVDENAAQAAALKKILDGGHQLASHTYSHDNMDLMTDVQMKDEINKTSDTIFKHSGVRPAYMRAPEGRCAELCTKTMAEMGQIISHWNIDTNDWRFTGEKDPLVATKKSMEEIMDVLYNKSDPATDSFILLQHEIHEFSVRHLANEVIDTVIKKGYRFVTMEECIGEPAYLPGSTVPSTVPVPPTGTTIAPTSGGPVAPTDAPGPVPTVSQPNGGATVSGGPKPTISTPPKGDVDSSAGAMKVASWALGFSALLGYALI